MPPFQCVFPRIRIDRSEGRLYPDTATDSTITRVFAPAIQRKPLLLNSGSDGSRFVMGVTGRYANGTVPVIMVVDDTDSARILLVRALQLAKLNAIGAADAYEALTLLERHRPSLLLLDLSMPDRDGFQLLADVRSDPRWRRLPIVVYSALSDRESIRRATELGATDYIVKASLPFREVIDRLRRYLPLSAEGGK